MLTGHLNLTWFTEIGSFRSYDGGWEMNFEVGQVFRDYCTMASCTKVSFDLMDTNGFEEKVENNKFMAAGSPCQNLKFQVVVKQT